MDVGSCVLAFHFDLRLSLLCRLVSSSVSWCCWWSGILPARASWAIPCASSVSPHAPHLTWFSRSTAAMRLTLQSTQQIFDTLTWVATTLMCVSSIHNDTTVLYIAASFLVHPWYNWWLLCLPMQGVVGHPCASSFSDATFDHIWYDTTFDHIWYDATFEGTLRSVTLSVINHGVAYQPLSNLCASAFFATDLMIVILEPCIWAEEPGAWTRVLAPWASNSLPQIGPLFWSHLQQHIWVIQNIFCGKNFGPSKRTFALLASAFCWAPGVRMQVARLYWKYNYINTNTQIHTYEYVQKNK